MEGRAEVKGVDTCCRAPGTCKAPGTSWAAATGQMWIRVRETKIRTRLSWRLEQAAEALEASMPPSLSE